MKIVILAPKKEFTKKQQERLAKLGQIAYSKNRDEYSHKALLTLCQNAQILAPDPDNLGGFEKAKENLNKLVKEIPTLKGLALSTTSYGWVDLDLCKKRGLPVANIPHYSRESVAEHTLALLFCLAKRIIETDRQTHKGQYLLQMGFELKGKTLGIIGLGSIGSRVAELGLAIGMKGIAYNRSFKKQLGVEMKSLPEVLRQSDALSIHLKDGEETENFLCKKEINMMKKGVIIVNTADRGIINEKELATALKSRQVFGYAYEGEDLENTPLAKIDTAIGLKGFGWYTKEALNNLVEIWIKNIEGMVKDRPENLVK